MVSSHGVLKRTVSRQGEGVREGVDWAGEGLGGAGEGVGGVGRV